jgi:hypothetical protein
VKQHGHESLFPAWVLEEIRQDYAQQLQVSISQQREILEIISAFSKSGLEFILLKGADYQLRLYGDAAVRPMADLDLCLDFRDLNRAEKTLKRLGYSISPQYHELRDGHRQLIANEIMFVPPGGKSLFIDLHWSIQAAAYYYHLPYQFLRESAFSIDYQRIPVLVLSPDHTLIYLCLNNYSHFPNLKCLLDLALALTQFQLDWAKIGQEIAGLGCQRPVYLILREVAAFLPQLVSKAILEQLASYCPSLLELVMLHPRLSYLSLGFPSFLKQGRLRRWPRYVYNYLWPHPDYLTAMFGKARRSAYFSKLLHQLYTCTRFGEL